MEWAIETHGLTKAYGDTLALDGIDLRIQKGTVYGLLGPNGAGKTTAIRVLTTLARPSTGTATVLGLDVMDDGKAVRKKIGVTGQFASVDEDLTGDENLVLVGRLHGLGIKGARARSAELLAAFGLTDAAKKQVRNYSGGMRRRLDIAASLVVTPEILFLDEPTTGLDPRSRNQVWDVVRAIASAGTTVLLTTQYLEEADRLADRLAVIDHGRIIAEGTAHELKRQVGANTLHLRLADVSHRDEAKRILIAFGVKANDGGSPDEVVAPIETGIVGRALDGLQAAGIAVTEHTMGAPSLDEVFFALTGRGTEAA